MIPYDPHLCYHVLPCPNHSNYPRHLILQYTGSLSCRWKSSWCPSLVCLEPWARRHEGQDILRCSRQAVLVLHIHTICTSQWILRYWSLWPHIRIYKGRRNCIWDSLAAVVQTRMFLASLRHDRGSHFAILWPLSVHLCSLRFVIFEWCFR